MKTTIFQNLVASLKQSDFNSEDMIAFTGKSGSYNLAFMGEKKNNYKIELEECFYISDSDEITAELTEEQIEELQEIIDKTVKEYTDTSEDGKYTDAYEFYGVSRSDF